MQVRSKGARLASFAATLGSVALLAGACSDATPTATDLEANFAKGGNGKAIGNSTVQIYEADLMPLNNSGVTGRARFMVVDGQLKAMVHAKGVTPGVVHPQHIHGFGIPSTQDAVCPPPSAANNIPGLPEQVSNPDRFIALEEGLPFYGPVLVPLDSDLSAPTPGSFPMANPAGVLNYTEKTMLPVMTTVGSATASMLDLEQRAVVLHGMVVDGEYLATLPVACGTIMQVK